MVRGAAKNHAQRRRGHLARPVRRSCRPRSPHGGFTLAQRQALAAAAFVHTATYDVAVASWMGNVVTDTSDGSGFPRWIGGDLGQGGRAALRREPAPAGRALPSTAPSRAGSRRRSSCTARRCPTTTTSTPTPRAGPRTTSTSRRWRSSSTPTRAASPSASTSPRPTARAHACDPVSAFGGVIATNATGQRGHGPAGRRGVHRGDRWRRRTRTAPSRCCRPRRTSGSWSSTRPPRWHRVPPDRRRAADAGRATPSTPSTTRPRAGRWPRGEPADAASAGRPRVRLEGVPRGQVQRDPARPRRRLGRGRHGPGQPGRLLPARGGAGGRSARRGRWPPPTRSSRSPTGRRSCSRPASRAIVQPGGSVRDAAVVEAAQAAGATLYLTGARHFYH